MSSQKAGPPGGDAGKAKPRLSASMASMRERMNQRKLALTNRGKGAGAAALKTLGKKPKPAAVTVLTAAASAVPGAAGAGTPASRTSPSVPGAGTDGAGPAVIAAVGLPAANTPVSQPAAAAATAAAAAESPTRPLTSGDTAAATTTAAGRELQTDRRLTNVELAERVCIEMPGGPGEAGNSGDAGAMPSRKRKAKAKASAAGVKAVKAVKLDVASLLSASSHKETQSKEVSSQISALLNTPSVLEQSLRDKQRPRDGTAIQEMCESITTKRCIAEKRSATGEPCEKLHFRMKVTKYTDKSKGDCSFLNDCRRGATCTFVHYEVDPVDRARVEALAKKKRGVAGPVNTPKSVIETQLDKTDMRTTPPQWIQCDVRKLHIPVLGKFSVIMADPPWDIHMDLPYGTMMDSEMLKLPFKEMMDDGYFFLWVTGRAMELGRKCLQEWGYEMKQELLWIKTNQLQKVIRTGRTGHWLNHGKEHCLIGVKGNPPKITRVLDCDVLVAEVRDTSHKPDEVYGLIERLSPGTRKLEVFGRPHNVQPNWVTLGNQLKGVNLVEPDMHDRFQAAYPYDELSTQKLLLTGSK